MADDSETFALQIARVLNDDKLRKDLSIAALNYANVHLSAESFSKKIKNIAKIFG